MMRILLIACCSLLVTCAVAAPIGSSKLINHAKQYDNIVIEFQGEAIGDIMVRGEHVWLNVKEGSSAIGVWAAKDMAKDIHHTGSYRFKGDQIKITGAFHRACLTHGGDLDIHADKIEIVKHGEKKLRTIYFERLIGGLILLILCIILIFYRHKPD